MQRKLIAGILLGAFVLLVVIAGLMARNTTPLSSRARGDVGVIYISGLITTGGSSAGLLGDVTAGSGDINRQLRKAADNPDLKAVVLRLNSPGGTVAGTQEIARELDRLKKSGKTVVASMGDVAASGAYWIAARCDKIVANPGTMTGSIGVIMQTQNLEGLYEKLGIEMTNLKKGKYKDMGSPARDMTEEEKAILQSMIEDDYRQFVRAVAEGRGMDLEKTKELATGRVFNGSQAMEVGLVDKMGNFYDAVNLAADMAGIKGEPRVVNIEERQSWWQLLEGVRLAPPGGEALSPVRRLGAYPAAWLVYLPGWNAEVRYDG